MWQAEGMGSDERSCHEVLVHYRPAWASWQKANHSADVLSIKL